MELDGYEVIELEVIEIEILAIDASEGQKMHGKRGRHDVGDQKRQSKEA